MSETTLKNLISHHFPNKGCIRLTPITTGKFNDSYWVQAGDEELVLRIAPATSRPFPRPCRRQAVQTTGVGYHSTSLKGLTWEQIK